MSLLDFLGAGKTVEQAHADVADLLVKIAPLLQDVENRAGGIGESWLDRIDGAYLAIEDNKIVIHLKPVPKAIAIDG